MSAIVRPPDGDQNRVAALLAIFWTPYPIAVALILARLLVRVRLNNLGVDDHLMFSAWAIYTISTSLASVCMIKGGARHLFFLRPDQIVEVLKFNFLSQPFGAMASALGKSSVAFFVLRIVGPNAIWTKRFVYVNVFIYMMATIISIVLTFAQCRPAKALWEPVIGAKCWDPTIAADVTIFQAAYGTYMDFVLVLLPISVILNLKMSLDKKIGLAILLGLGTFAGIISAIKTAQLHNYASRADFTWSVYSIFAWSSLEIALVIICGCVPTVKPIYDRLRAGKPLKPSRTEYPSRRWYNILSGTKQSSKATLVGRSGNSTKITAVNGSPLHSAHKTERSFDSPGAVFVEQEVDVIHGGRASSRGSESEIEMVDRV